MNDRIIKKVSWGMLGLALSLLAACGPSFKIKDGTVRGPRESEVGAYNFYSFETETTTDTGECDGIKSLGCDGIDSTAIDVGPVDTTFTVSKSPEGSHPTLLAVQNNDSPYYQFLLKPDLPGSYTIEVAQSATGSYERGTLYDSHSTHITIKAVSPDDSVPSLAVDQEYSSASEFTDATGGQELSSVYVEKEVPLSDPGSIQNAVFDLYGREASSGSDDDLFDWYYRLVVDHGAAYKSPFRGKVPLASVAYRDADGDGVDEIYLEMDWPSPLFFKLRLIEP